MNRVRPPGTMSAFDPPRSGGMSGLNLTSRRVPSSAGPTSTSTKLHPVHGAVCSLGMLEWHLSGPVISRTDPEQPGNDGGKPINVLPPLPGPV